MRVVNVMISKVYGGVEQAFLDYNDALLLEKNDVLAILHKKGLVNKNWIDTTGDLTNKPGENLKNSIKTSENSEENLAPASVEILPKIIKKTINFCHWNFLAIPFYYSTLKKFKPDVIIVHSKKAIPIFRLVAKLLHVKIVAVAHNEKFKLIDKCDAIFSITHYQKDLFIAKGFSAEKVFVLPNMLKNVPEFKPLAEFRKPPVIGVMGRFDPAKGFTIFVQALEHLKQKGVKFTAVIGGSANSDSVAEVAERELIMALVEKFELQDFVEFSGWVADKKTFYNNIDLFVLPSVYEPFGIVLLEAMGNSVPVVSSLASGPAEIFAGKNSDAAMLFEVGNSNELAECLEAAIVDFSATQEMAKKGWQLVLNNYSMEIVAKKLNNAIICVAK